jgi:plasmid maintenance system killer protein
MLGKMCCQSEITSSNNKTLNARLLAETQVCHRSYIIAARNNSTNLMVYGETGRYSIYINTKLRILYFWNIVTVMIMVFNATFSNISVISWRSVLLVEETGENHQPAVSH